METIQINPANSDHFKSLESFANEANKLCRKNGISPIVYGSLAYIFYTRDETIAINDVDFLVSENDFEKITRLLTAIPGTTYETTDYHSIKFFNNACKIAFDDISHYLGDRKWQSLEAIINEKHFELVDRETLKFVYEQGANNIPIKKDAYHAKLEKLQ